MLWEVVCTANCMLVSSFGAHRLAQRCAEFRGEVEDMDLYRMVVEGDQEKVTQFLCYNEENEKLSRCSGGRDSTLFAEDLGFTETEEDYQGEQDEHDEL